MKWGCSILLFMLVLCCTGWVMLQQTQHGEQPPTAKANEGGGPIYPADLWSNPSLQREIEISQAAPLTESESAHLCWQRGEGVPPLGDPQAKRGGVLRVSNVGPYPAHFLAFGSASPQFFHYNLFTCIDIPLLRQHPLTGELLPGLAESWAQLGRSIHFRLHKQARYSNGQPLRAADFALGAALRAKAGKDGAWQKLASLVERIQIRGEHELSITLRREMPLAPLMVASVLHPAEPRFYAEFGSDYATRYAPRIPPTTGAYMIDKQQRGRMIRLQRVPHWWGDTVPHFRHTCNVDAIEYHFLTDESQAWELLRRGQLNLLQTRHLAGWLQKREEYADETHLHFTRSILYHPLPPYGIAINAKALPCIHLRRGIVHALDMNKAIFQVFCGEYERLQSFTGGYPWQKESTMAAPDFSPEKARACFAEAGYTHTGNDGILQREDGSRLSISLIYPPSGKNSAIMSILAQQARLCGLELRTEAVSWQLSSRMMQEQRQQLLFWATVATPHLPNYARHFAADATGHDAPFCLKSAAMQTLLQRYAACRHLDEVAQLCQEIDATVALECIWVPAWKENRAFSAHAPQVRFPQDTRLFGACDVADSHLLWIEK